MTAGSGPSTRAIHAGYEPDGLYGPINTPIYASTTFAQDGLAKLRGGYEYTRVGNPTITALEETVAALEGADFAVAYASGMAAVDTVLRVLLRPGDHIVIGSDAYGGTYRLIQQVFTQWGIENTVVNMTDTVRWRRRCGRTPRWCGWKAQRTRYLTWPTSRRLPR